MASFWEYFSVLAPSVGLGLIFWLVMRSLFRADSGERNARAELEEREAREWALLQEEGRGGGRDRHRDDPQDAAPGGRREAARDVRQDRHRDDRQDGDPGAHPRGVTGE